MGRFVPFHLMTHSDPSKASPLEPVLGEFSCLRWPWPLLQPLQLLLFFPPAPLSNSCACVHVLTLVFTCTCFFSLSHTHRERGGGGEVPALIQDPTLDKTAHNHRHCHKYYHRSTCLHASTYKHKHAHAQKHMPPHQPTQEQNGEKLLTLLAYCAPRILRSSHLSHTCKGVDDIDRLVREFRLRYYLCLLLRHVRHET